MEASIEPPAPSSFQSKCFLRVWAAYGIPQLASLAIPTWFLLQAMGMPMVLDLEPVDGFYCVCLIEDRRWLVDRL